MEERFDKRGRVARSKGGGFFLVSDSGRETSVDQEAVSVWSMFVNKTVEEVADVVMGDRDASDARKSVASIASDLEKAGLLARV